MRDIDTEQIEIELLLEALYRAYGYDFRSYARASIERRTRQFLSRKGIKTVSEMIGKVLREKDLSSQLAQYFSIPVTEMFRDPFVFRAVREQVVPLLRTWPHFKVWCAGCATGEEVYSLAILLQEEDIYERATIYATDFNDVSLDSAKEGVYSMEKIREATINYQHAGGRRSFADYYMARYDAVVMDNRLKERITFANHNLATDGVFAETHLIFCRNVLIYFDRDLQNRALRLYTDSLVHGGFLCLGTKENLQFTEVTDLYRTINGKAKIYRKWEM